MPRGSNLQKITQDMAVEALLECKGAVAAAARLIYDKHGVEYTDSSMRYRRDLARRQGVEIPDPPVNRAAGQRDPDSMAEQRRRKIAVEDGLLDEEDARPIADGRIDPREAQARALPGPGEVATYLITGAVNNTHIHPAFWRNLQALARHYDAEIIVRPIHYNLNAYRRMGADTEDESAEGDEIWFDPAVRPYLSTDRVALAPDCHFAGDAPITATAATPLSGYDTFTGRASGIFAATKVEMRSVATMRAEPAKLLFTTGAVTQRNYTETKTGQKADHHHTYGAMLVEVDSAGQWWPRHIIAGEDGTCNDIGLTVRGGRVRPANNIAALTPGDIHVAQLDQSIRSTLFGPGGMVDVLRPAELHLHDLHDHLSRSHHNARDPFKLFQLRQAGKDSVLDEVRADADFLKYCHRDWLQTVVIASNHDDHLRRWVTDADWKSDPINARFYLRCAERMLGAIEDEDNGFHLLEWACREMGAPGAAVFLQPDQSWQVEGIECGLHGDKGPNGSRGSARSIAKTGSKSTIGHSHSAGIFEGCWQTGVTAGTLDDLDMGYNSGPSSWSRALVATYRGGKRTMMIMRGLQWRADRSEGVRQCSAA